MFCPHCPSSQFLTVSELLRHIRLLHAGDSSITFQCNLQGCRRTFGTFNVYRNHIYNFHDVGMMDQSSSCDGSPLDLADNESDSDSGDSDSDSSDGPTVEQQLKPEYMIQRAAAISMLKNRELHRIPLSVMDEIVSDNQSLFSTALSYIRENVRKDLDKAGVSQATILSATRHLEDSSPLTRLYSGLETQHKQTNFFRSQLRMVVCSISMHALVNPK